MTHNTSYNASKRLPDIISEPELHQILSVTRKLHLRIAFALGFYQAMRVSEIVKLLPENIDLQSKLIKIVQSKGAKDRNIAIAPQVYKSLKTFKPFGYKNVKSGVRAFEIAFKKAARKVLNKDMHFHELRHSGLSYYATIKKWDTLELMRFAGHSNANTTSIYYHINPAQQVARMWELS